MRNSMITRASALAFLLSAALGACGAEGAPGPDELSPPSDVPAPSRIAGFPQTGGAGAVTGGGGTGGVAGDGAAPAGSGSSTGGAGADAIDDVGGAPVAPPDDSEPEPARVDLGVGDGTDVITIGDSYMRQAELIPGLVPPAGIEVSLERVSGRDYRNFGSGGDPATNTAAAMINGVIPMQYTTAKSANPNIATVVAVGGGNDAPESNNACAGAATEADRTPACVAVCDMVNQAAAALLDQMAADGVKDVIWISYAASLMAQGVNYTGFIQNLRTVRAEQCVTDNPAWGGMRCHLVDSDPLIQGSFAFDGVHPSEQANDRIGTAVWELMQTEGLRR